MEEPQRNLQVQGKQDSLNSEFVYYSAVLKVVGPTVSNENDRKLIRDWIKKLFRPEYQSSKLKEKRNRYLAHLTISLLLDEVVGIFRTPPPVGALPDLEDLPMEPIQASEWELDKMWQDTLLNLPENFKLLECSVHKTKEECQNDHKLDKILDQEFQLMLFMARPYAALLSNGSDRTRVAAWLQILCSIHGTHCCSSMKAIRNDYIMALLGYLQDLRAVGPFSDLPPWATLVPLVEAAQNSNCQRPITDPSGPESNDFLADQPMPDNGAFCYIAITGDLIDSSFNK